MTKKQIKLTEGMLRNIIKESVVKILNELDYKTLANAEKGARAMGDASYWRDRGAQGYDAISKATNARMRAKRFGDAAKDAFNRDDGLKNGHTWDDDYASVELGGDFDSTEEFSPHVVGYKSKGYGNPAKYEYGRNRENYQDMSPEEFFQDNPEAAETFRNADTEFKNFKKGKYGYEKGKGWELK